MTDRSSPRWKQCFADAIEYFHEQVDREIHDHTTGGEHSDRPTTAREYYNNRRGWTDETIEKYRLGYAPSDGGVIEHLLDIGYEGKDILSTGLVNERPDGTVTLLWRGRYVLPYFDADGSPVYAISRSTGRVGGGAAGYDGHPSDFMAGKYAKPAHTKDYARVKEPIFGLRSIRDGEPVLITEGIGDAITAHQAGYPCVSPVTTRFKHNDREKLREILESHEIPRAYVIQDSERPSNDLDENGKLSLTQMGEGLSGALDTAEYLTEHGVDVRLAELPRVWLDKVDLDDYLHEWNDSLNAVLASAKPAREHPRYEEPEEPQTSEESIDKPLEREKPTATSEIRRRAARAGLFDLTIADVTGLSEGYRGANPLGHHGESENYFVIYSRDGELFGWDYKYKVGYNSLTYLLCEAGVRSPGDPNGRVSDREIQAAYDLAVEQGLIDDVGYSIPQIVECKPPFRPELPEFSADEYHDHLMGERYDEFIENNGPMVWADPLGAGKTTSSGLAAARRDRPFRMLFATHEKAREFVCDEVAPDGLYHLKGASQPRDAHCMDSRVAEEPCSEHGSNGCPSMCPMYDLDPDDPRRQQFDAVVSHVGTMEAHLILDLHEEDCPWLEQYDEIPHQDRVVSVHEYQTQKSVQEGDVIIDEASRPLISESRLSSDDLRDAADFLLTLNDENAREFASFALRIAECVRNGRLHTHPPAIDWKTTTVVPWEAAEPLFADGAGTISTENETTTEHRAETLARLRIKFNEKLLQQMREGEWDAAPSTMEALIGAASMCGLDREACAGALATPPTLRRCPWCNSMTGQENGARACYQCNWHEAKSSIVPEEHEQRRHYAFIENSRLHFEHLPLQSELPDAPLLLDATATRDRVRALYGDATIVGDTTFNTGLHITQITDGQYHGSTINSDSLRAKIQTIIEHAGEEYDAPLFGAKKRVLSLFEFPDNAQTIHYGGLRGLNFTECDAVFALGAPHWHPEALKRNAELFAQNTELRPGGMEYSTRPDTEEPIYRKYIYDDNGTGFAAPTKAFSGLTGQLFYEQREKELKQFVHRARPILRDVDAYLLTNVPTDMPVDVLCTLNELVEEFTGIPPGTRGVVLEAFERRGECTASRLAGDLDIGTNQTRTHLDALVESGHIAKKSFGQTTKYMSAKA